MSDDLLNRVARAIVEFGEFELRSGQTSDHYLNVKRLAGFPLLERDLIETSIKPEIVGGDYTCIAGYGVGGQHLASLVGSICEIPTTLVRDEKKRYGTMKVFEGHEPANRDVVLIIDDVLTTGGSLRETRNLIAPTGASFDYLVVVNRADKIPGDFRGRLKYIFNEEELLEAARA